MPAQPVHRLAPLLALLAACGGQEPPPARTPDQIVVAAGDRQTAAAGTPLPNAVRFLVSDQQGPLSGVQVTFSLTDATGFVNRRSDTTRADGSVSVTWTVGGTLGDQSLSGTVAGVAPAVAHATVTVGRLALLSPTTPANQVVVVGRAVAAAPTVRASDAFGNPIGGAAVEFSDPAGLATLEGDTQTTDPAGIAGLTTWRIPNLSGVYQVKAVAPATGATATFTAFSAPAATTIAGGNNQAANAGTAVPLAPTVLAVDDSGASLANVTVAFSVQGGGRLVGSGSVKTDATGLAAAPTWILSLVPGPNELKAEVLGTPPILFAATGVMATPAQAAPVSIGQQAGFLGNFPGQMPRIRLTDAGGQPVAGAPVSFVVTAGGGAVARSSAVSDFQGEAALGAWRLGPSEAVQTVEARPDGLPPVVFTANATAPPPSAFHIEVRFIGAQPTAAQKAAFDSAAARWESLVVGDLEDIPFHDDLSFCGGQNIDETVDDLLIFASIESIDGPGGVLGSAYWCWARDDNLLPFIGRMQFDVADVNQLIAAGQFERVVLHEMGHILGIGSIWADQSLLVGAGTGDPYFTGPSGRGAFAAADFTNYAGNTIPVENTGGPGTQDSHWREAILGPELMTGFLNDGDNPLSAVTVASLRDQGYQVNDAAADPYTLGAALRALTAGPPRQLLERPWTGVRRTMDRSGHPRRTFLPNGPRR
jgi:Leishmanolysin